MAKNVPKKPEKSKAPQKQGSAAAARTVQKNAANSQPKPVQRSAQKPAPKPAGKPVGQAPQGAKKTPTPVSQLKKQQNSQQPVKKAAPVGKQVQNIRPKPTQNTPKKPPKKPVKKPPVNKKTKAAVSKAMRSRQAAPKRHKFRGGNYILYYLMAGFVALVALVILANTVLFNCKVIVVEGAVRYSPEEVIAVSGLKAGENLLRVDSKTAGENVVNALAYIDEATVSKSYPTKLVINVTEAEKQYCIYQNGVYAAISRGGKIIEHCPPGELTVVRGYEAETLDVGSRLKSKTDGKNGIPAEIFSAVEKTGIKNVDEIDITDRFSIKITVEGRIFLELGTISRIESKLIVAKTLIDTEIGSTESVSILLTNPEMAAMTLILPDAPEDEEPPLPEEPNVENPPEVPEDPPENSGESAPVPYG